MAGQAWTDDAIRALGVQTNVETAGAIFGLSRTQAYEAIKANRFPISVIRVGRRLVVPVAPIRRLLELDANTAGPAPPEAPVIPPSQ